MKTLGILLLLACLPLLAGMSGRVVKVTDGDTLEIRMDGGKADRVRLTGIDAPELSQEHGQEAKAALTKWADAMPVPPWEFRKGRK